MKELQRLSAPEVVQETCRR